MVKNLPPMQETQETWVQSPGREDSLEEEIATHSSILRKMPWTEESGRLYSPWAHKELNTTKQRSMHTFNLFVCIFMVI